MSTGNPNDTSKPAGSKGAHYHRECTGAALETAERHAKSINTPQDDGICIFGAAFCPFVQRAWIVLEMLGVEYQYREVDPYQKPSDLLALNPKGLVPSLKLSCGDKPGEVMGLGESTVIVEYLLERFQPPPSGTTLLPPLSEPYARAVQRLAVFRGNQSVVPAFYRFLQSQPDSDPEHHIKREEYIKTLTNFTQSMHPEGPFWAGKQISVVDCNLFPWIFRTTNVLRHFRGLQLQDWGAKEGRMAQWLEAMMKLPAVAGTCSTEELYLDSYARYAENRKGTSQVADATNTGRSLP
ncbi:glutathione S-transferase [Tilletiaria anomala UBC 951]|uniref:Glutathione S-transferase n=1 Tax=Tilletiaria anomala (strain ATCC 24038 / CBS 436.72 / UBC 951) TaxID=1037660 RepID=A0A066VPU9_TILAU|nr:glutathione S-transferase [Tilletiaria anomala UBC 951]KDN43767.1 glutathione S-transferase [Tilletiaria anomala UBC 951]